MNAQRREQFEQYIHAKHPKSAEQILQVLPGTDGYRWAETVQRFEDFCAGLDAAGADAKRYHWLRDKTSMPGVICTNSQVEKYFNEYMMCGEVMDRAIDAAMEAEQTADQAKAGAK